MPGQPAHIRGTLALMCKETNLYWVEKALAFTFVAMCI